MKLTYLLVSPFKGMWILIEGASISWPGLALPKSRMERSVPPTEAKGGSSASFRLLLPPSRLTASEEWLLPVLFPRELVLSRSCCTRAVSFLFLLKASVVGGAAVAALVAAAAEDVGGTDDMLVNEFLGGDGFFGGAAGAGGGGGARLTSMICGLVICGGACRTGLDDKGVADVDS